MAKLKSVPNLIQTVLNEMDPSNRDFTNFFPNQHPANANENSPPQQFPIGFPQSAFPQYPAPNFQNFHLFGSPPGNYPPYVGSSPSFHGIQQHANWLQSSSGFRPQQSFVNLPNPVSGAAANSSSHGSESASPCPAREEGNNIVNLEESSGNSDDGGRRGTRMNWTEDENIRLLSSWLNNSVDPIDGNDKKSEYY